MGSDKDIFTVHGVKELGRELKEMAQGFQNKMVRPGLTVGLAEIRKEAKRLVPVDSGVLKKEIKSKVFSKGRGKGLVGRAGIITSVQVTDAYGRSVQVAKYAAVQNFGSPKRNIKATHWLEDSLARAEDRAVEKLIMRVQEKVDAFHSSKGDPGKGKK